MLRSRPFLILKRVYHYNRYQSVESLRERYKEKKLRHIHAAEKDKATILSMNTLHNQNKLFEDKKKAIYGLGFTSPNEVFINNELNLSHIDVYGFDYDYTLADYTDNLSLTIYNSLRDIMVDVFKYPRQIKDFKFDSNFAIRGLHYDFNNGWLMKIDNMANIQLNTIHLGREPIQDVNKIIELHKGQHISPDYLRTNMFQLSDLFSIPQATLLSDVVQYFRDHNMNFHPRYLSDDVNIAARILHTGAHGIGGTLHLDVMKDLPRYLERSPKLVDYLEHLRKQGKKTFLLTNSTLAFIDKGMTYLTTTHDWRDLFDCVIVSARKPEFYYHFHRPFRRANEPNWDTVDNFLPGEIYQGGNMKDFERLTGWKGQRVLYFGDHIFSDLIEASIQHGWHTGAIIHELAKEIDIRNQPSYRHTLSWLIRLESLLNEAQTTKSNNKQINHNDQQLEILITEWKEERNQIKIKLKNAFNESFGSLFRTYQNPSYFANKIQRYADIYMSNITNLDHVSVDYVFYPNRTYLPHERFVETLIDTGGKISKYLL
ncbi:HAD-superfamily hydrolase [Cokeromyces recurvatus]|uniref:HAD-superfamily hydrolase n=1 Tax=Cokeromyces recurvatus TaxID=90255 RepID=UPI00221E4615|nr:HAD-superfamily hydrolase [Cokeromyces recurvatus]KAI7901270.1 HAD-superfamily hydrolase [Cokeromyces recurvatus]